MFTFICLQYFNLFSSYVFPITPLLYIYCAILVLIIIKVCKLSIFDTLPLVQWQVLLECVGVCVCVRACMRACIVE